MDNWVIPGDRLDIRIDWRGLRIWCTIFAASWLLLSAIFLIPAVGSWFSEERVSTPRWGAFLGVTIGTVVLLLLGAWPYFRASALIFTTAGVWEPDGHVGRLLPWNEIIEAKVANNRFLVLLGRDGQKIRVLALAFEDADALMRLIRERVAPTACKELPSWEEA
jgi:hypothetical protein